MDKICVIFDILSFKDFFFTTQTLTEQQKSKWSLCTVAGVIPPLPQKQQNFSSRFDYMTTYSSVTFNP